MITIFAVFCQLAFLHVHCAPKSSHNPEINNWKLSEASIKWESPLQPTEHYTRDVKLFRYDNDFRLDSLVDGTDEDRKLIACFTVDELHAFLDSELYVVIQHPNRVIRMTLADEKESKTLTELFKPAPNEYYRFEALKRYYIFELVVSDGLAHRQHKDNALDDTAPISLTVYGGVDRGGNKTDDRRFIISGGEHNQLFAAFNRDEFMYIRKDSDDRLVLSVRPPGTFRGKFYFIMRMLYFRDDKADRFVKEMSLYTCSSKTTSETSTSSAENVEK